MKRFLTLLLAAAMVLSFAACGDNGTTIRNENEKDNVKKDPIAAQYLQDLAVKTADYPVLPAMPNESELDEAFSTRGAVCRRGNVRTHRLAPRCSM